MVILAAILSGVTMLAAWYVDMHGLGSIRGQVGAVVFGVCLTLGLSLLMDLIRVLQERATFRHWLKAAE